ncbi:putative aminopeptidase [Aquicella siphonis]|uniref:Putative aminopeptidase n=1 Tax=Aquicella siphonis TaxID=254247 RepID=A0A5E4PJB3_9COXI|nr:P1 family peptidase [Aquicella siphonis]VVC76527.1 putative aminopeptidase [Aquicella siphonis]
MDGYKTGHYTNQKAGTGVSVFLFENGATGSYWICGSAPATHELAVLDPDNSVPHLYGLVLAGGSAYGLHAALGVMTYLGERRIGHPTPHGVVPIVPAAAIYDLSYQLAVAPTAEEAYQACLAAESGRMQSGRIGAGTGATVGKLVPQTLSMSGGLGTAEVRLPDGVIARAYAVVNAVGDVRDSARGIIAGARYSDGSFANCERYLLSGQAEIDLFRHANTTLVVVITNARFHKSELKRIAKMAAAGISRAITPVFTQFDGDILFCISAGDKQISELTMGTMAAEAVNLAIMDAVKGSEVI